jgi:CelD/BcsL family acetyltransferase involved in cellulose biosynthesis
MKTTVEIQDSIEPLTRDWECLAQHAESSPFLWPGWFSAWWHAFGKGQLRILAAYQDDRLAGVLPLQRFRGTLSSTTNSETPLFGFLTTNEMATKQLSESLFRQRARRIDLSLMDPTDCGVPQARAAAGVMRYQVISDSIQGSPYVALHGRTWGEFQSGLRRKFRSELRRRHRRLEEKGRLTLEIFDGTERLDELLEEGLRIEGSGWKEARGTSINVRPATRRFYAGIARWAAERGWLRLAFLRLDGRALAFDYCLENKTHYLLKTGYDTAYGRFAPGMVLRYLMLARAFSEGLATYEFLGRFEAWKQEWTSESRELQFLRMFSPTVPGFLDQAACMSLRTAGERARSLARTQFFPERGRRLLEQASFEWHRMLDRRRTS